MGKRLAQLVAQVIAKGPVAPPTRHSMEQSRIDYMRLAKFITTSSHRLFKTMQVNHLQQISKFKISVKPNNNRFPSRSHDLKLKMLLKDQRQGEQEILPRPRCNICRQSSTSRMRLRWAT